MKKIFLFFFLLLSFSFADIISNVSLLSNKNKCIFNDYYYKDGRFYYRYLTSPNTWRSTSSVKYANYIFSGYKYDTDLKKCYPDDYLILGLDIKQFRFLEALTGLLFGFVFMFFSIYIFTIVGGKR